MAAITKVTLAVFAVALLMSSSSAEEVPAGAEETSSLYLSPGAATRALWQQCDYSTQAGSTCVNCNARLICTKVGGFLKPCPVLRPYCINGICSNVPSAQCASTSPEPATTSAPEDTATEQ